MNVNDVVACVTPQTIHDFADDGVVVLRQAIDSDWIEKLRIGIEKKHRRTDRARARLKSRRHRPSLFLRQSGVAGCCRIPRVCRTIADCRNSGTGAGHHAG